MPFTPLSIGSLQLDSNVIQGPLAGVSCAPFRERFADFIMPAYCVTEMISAHDLVHNPRLKRRYSYRSKKEGRLCFQLSGTDENYLADACKRAQSLGADLIDLNAGCPKTKIRKKGAGSALLRAPLQLEALVSAMRRATSLPLTVKIRVDGDSSEAYSMDAAKAIEQAGADALIVHGRHWQDDYDTPCRYEDIKTIVENITIPVIANGDVRCYQSYQKLLKNTGAKGVMISRAGSGKPWLYQQLKDASYQPDLRVKKQQLYLHIEALAGLDGEFLALMQARKLARYYLRNDWSQQQIEALYSCQTLADLASALAL